jgi:hypothetical protein
MEPPAAAGCSLPRRALDALAKRYPLGQVDDERNGHVACMMAKQACMGARSPPLQQQQLLLTTALASCYVPTSTIRSGARSIDRPCADKRLATEIDAALAVTGGGAGLCAAYATAATGLWAQAQWGITAPGDRALHMLIVMPPCPA